MDKKEIQDKINILEQEMAGGNFWDDKNIAQEKVKELQKLKADLEGVGQYDRGDAVMTIYSGAGGDDSEDFSRMLHDMYFKYCNRVGYDVYLVHENKNDHDGYRNVTFAINGAGAYGKLKNESGVHRLVRISPFNSKKLRHTSFSLVEVIPKFKESAAKDFVIDPKDLKIEFSRSSGPGGQNVNKRETAVRIVHIPTNIAVHADTERSQEQNRDIAMALLKGKLFKKEEDDKKKKESGMYISKTTEIEWGNQIRSYVQHPYKMVKDHRTDVETSDVDGVLEGEIDIFINAENSI